MIHSASFFCLCFLLSNAPDGRLHLMVSIVVIPALLMFIAVIADLTIIEQQTKSEYTRITCCPQTGDLPQKSLLDVGRTKTTVNYQQTMKL
ncbi:SLAM family member 9-like isoform X1 [Labeo rohita]|uniref:SLAM family member 9-like isoform X1 n=1 Tax=Labeo rohita TaxID=84645 RepID=A0A498N9A4_LABRO|nr:SLAM family member 9-like isoform X1 [Labeo rohita]RXN27216.1 SLAM family member 9-like isoform X1 [Labeo rohita]